MSQQKLAIYQFHDLCIDLKSMTCCDSVQYFIYYTSRDKDSYLYREHDASTFFIQSILEVMAMALHKDLKKTELLVRSIWRIELANIG